MSPVSSRVPLQLAGLAFAAAVSVVTLTTAAGQAKAADNTLTAAEKAAGWELLFDGTTLDKWRGYRATTVPANWSVVDGTIAAKKARGADIVSVDEYGDFEFAVDFNVAKDGNSGIFYRGLESQTGPIYHSAPEYQILDNDGHPDAKNGPDRFCGANYAIEAAARLGLQPARPVELGQDRRQGRAHRALAERQENRSTTSCGRPSGRPRSPPASSRRGPATARRSRATSPSRPTATRSRSRTSRFGSSNRREVSCPGQPVVQDNPCRRPFASSSRS